MNNSDKDSYLKRYNSRFYKFGYDPRSLGWGGGIENQYLRFQKSLEFSKFTSSSISSVLDVGCGFGDLGNWLSKKHPNIEYTGIDINSNLTDVGKEKFGLNLSQKNVFEYQSNSFDIVVSNGIFNAQLDYEDQLKNLENYLVCFYRISKIGFTTDFMSNYVDYKHAGAYHTNEQDVIRIIKRFTKRYIIRNDYLDFEFMIYVFK